jgi:FkbM family methyltransferase
VLLKTMIPILSPYVRPYVSDSTWRSMGELYLRVEQARSAARDRLIYLRDKTHVCQVREQTIKIRVSNYLEKYRAETYATKEPDTLEWLDEHLRDGDVFFDVGANIGLYSLYAGKLRPSATVFAFEPESLNFARLCGNVLANRLDNVIPTCIPLTDRETFDYFRLSEFNAGSSCHGFGEGGTAEFVGGEKPNLRQGMLGTSIDILVERHGLARPNLIKVDVDGIEERITSGMMSTLKHGSVRTVLIEITSHRGNPGPIPEQLAGLGFQLRRRGIEHKYGEYACQNHIYERT